MNILIVVPRFNSDIRRSYSFPLGLAYVTSALKQQGLNVTVLNLNQKEGDTKILLQKYIEIYNINILLSGGLSQHLNLLKEIFRTAKETSTDIVTIGGGGGYTSEPIIFSELTEVDYAIVGEGEITTTELIKAIINKESVDKIDGVVFKNESEYIKNKDREVIADIDKIAFPDYDAFEIEEYLSKQFTNDFYFMYVDDEPRNLPMIMGRSCPYDCNFCFHPLGKKYRQRSLDNFFEELKMLVSKYKINSISIYDELFSVSKERVYEFCERIKYFNLKWIVQMRVDIIDDDILREMKKAGCCYISYGLESMNKKVLSNMKKKITPEAIEKALMLTYKNEIGIQGNFIFGDEEEDFDTFNETMSWWVKNKKYQINLNCIIALPGTKLYENAVKRGVIKDRNSFIKEGCPIVNLTRLSNDDFNKMKGILKIKKQKNEISGEVLDIAKQEEDNLYTITLKCYHCNNISTIKNFFIDRSIEDYKNFRIGCRKCNRRSYYYINE